MIEASAYTGEMGGMLAMAFASGAVATFGYSWAFFVLPARALIKEMKGEVAELRVEIVAERDRCDEAMKEAAKERDAAFARMDAKYHSDTMQIIARVRELELLLNFRSVLQQKDQLYASAIRIAERHVDDEDKKGEQSHGK